MYRKNFLIITIISIHLNHIIIIITRIIIII